jgi:hypothetical protein
MKVGATVVLSLTLYTQPLPTPVTLLSDYSLLTTMATLVQLPACNSLLTGSRSDALLATTGPIFHNEIRPHRSMLKSLPTTQRTKPKLLQDPQPPLPLSSHITQPSRPPDAVLPLKIGYRGSLLHFLQVTDERSPFSKGFFDTCI